MRALVTGGTGFIGRQVVRLLADQGWEVVALARRVPARPLPAQFVVADARALMRSGIGGRFDRVYHLAALVAFAPAQRAELLSVNVDGTVSVLDAARGWGARTVLISSACTLGTCTGPDPLRDERDEASVEEVRRNPYLESKLLAESVARSRAKDQWVAIVNPTTVYGPGDDSLNSGTLIRQVAWSRVVPCPPGGSSVVDVEDVASGILAAGELGASGERYVLTGENLSYRDLFVRVAAALGRRPLLVRVPRAAGPILASVAAASGRVLGGRFLNAQIVGDLFRFRHYDASKARTRLGWVARRPIEESVRRAWDYYRTTGIL